MKNYNAFSAYASLAVIGLRMRQMKIWKTIEEHVQIHQKTIRHTPLEKLLDAFINILAGGRDGWFPRRPGRSCFFLKRSTRAVLCVRRGVLMAATA